MTLVTLPHSRPLTLRPTGSHLAMVIVGLISLPALAEHLTYTLRPDPQHQQLHVELEWKTGDRTESILSIAENWASVREPVRFVHDLAFAGDLGSEDHHHIQVIEHEPGATIKCTYTIRTGERSFDWDRTYWPITWRKFFHGIGQTFLFTPHPPEYTDEQFDVEVAWQLPDGWKEAVCSFGPGIEAGGILRPLDIRESVFLAGRLDVREMMVGGVAVTVAMHDIFHFDADQFARLATGIMEAEITFMNERDFPDYVITLIPVGDPQRPGNSRRGGTGLFRSFALFLPPLSKLDADVSFLFAHELFHHWNGRILNRESPEELVYWVSEGFTDYYAFRVLLEQFPEILDDLAARLNRKIRRYHHNEAIAGTNQDILQRFWTERATYGELPYQRGMLLALRWHHLARRHGVEDGIDRLFKTLVDRARTNGYRLGNDSIRAAGVELLGVWFAEEFDRFVTNGERIEIPPDVLAPHLSGHLTTEYSYDLGFDFDRSRDTGHVAGLVDGSAAAKADLRAGDALVGWRLTRGDPEQPVQLSVRRGDERVEIEYLPRGEKREFLQFVRPGHETDEDDPGLATDH